MTRTWALAALTNQVWLLVHDNPIRWVTVENGEGGDLLAVAIVGRTARRSRNYGQHPDVKLRFKHR